MDQRPPLTLAGAERLRAELDRLKKEERPAIIAAIAEARAHGDLKENAEYHAAREQQGFIEARIKELESGISNARIIDPTKLDPGDKVVFGARVTLADCDGDDEVTYTLVGDLESDIRQNLLSISSPVARALIGKQVGDEVEVQAPGGTRCYEVIDVSYA
jgi:transcription elongation factor GreA